MHLRAVLVIALSAVVVAQGDGAASQMASVSEESRTVDFAFPTSEISAASVVRTALPSSLLSSLTDPAFSLSYASEFAAGSTPSWYTALPTELRSFLNQQNSAAANATDTSGSSSSTAEVSSDESESTTAGVSSGTSEPTTDASGQTTESPSSSSSSTGGVPAPTGAIVAGMAGAAGVLAIALGL